MPPTLHRYVAALSARDPDAMLAELSPDIEHHLNERRTGSGRIRLAEVLAHMNHCGAEEPADIASLTNDDGTRAAAELVVNRTHFDTDPGLPEAKVGTPA